MRNFLLSLALLFGVNAFAADNTSFTINGSGFGSNSANQVFLGGSAGPIESQSNGTSAGTVGTSGIFGSGWNVAGAAVQASETVSTTRAWSATKSLREDNQAGVQYQYGVVYDTGAQYTTVYVRYYIYIETSASAYQVKMVRHSGTTACGDGLTDDDSADTYYLTNAGTSIFAINYATGCSASDNTLTPAVYITPTTDYPVPLNKWVLVEYSIKFSSAVGVADGVYHIRLTDVTANTLVVDYTKSSTLTWVASDVARPVRYITQHGYIGNLTPSNAQVYVWWDSNFYFATTPSGTTTPSWVLRCDNATWASVTKCAVQKWDTWGSTAIAIHRNYANVTSNAWYYVMTDINTPTSTTGIADSENGGGTDINGSGASTLGIDTASGGGTLAISGSGAVTLLRDTAAGSGYFNSQVIYPAITDIVGNLVRPFKRTLKRQ